MSAEERRRHSRVKFDGTVEFAVEGSPPQPAELHDVSMAGFYLQVARPPELHTPCHIRLELSEDIGIDVDGEVVRIGAEPGVVGVRIVQIGVESLAHLYRLVTLNYGDASQIDAELFGPEFQSG